jgi:hypothetical protein
LGNARIEERHEKDQLQRQVSILILWSLLAHALTRWARLRRACAFFPWQTKRLLGFSY